MTAETEQIVLPITTLVISAAAIFGLMWEDKNRARRLREKLIAENRALVCAMRLRVVKVGYIEDEPDGVRIVGWIFKDEQGRQYDEHAAHVHFLWGYTAADLREIAARPSEFIESS